MPYGNSFIRQRRAITRSLQAFYPNYLYQTYLPQGPQITYYLQKVPDSSYEEYGSYGAGGTVISNIASWAASEGGQAAISAGAEAGAGLIGARQARKMAEERAVLEAEMEQQRIEAQRYEAMLESQRVKPDYMAYLLVGGAMFLAYKIIQG